MVIKNPVTCWNCGKVVFDDFPSLMVIYKDVKCPKCGSVVLHSNNPALRA